MMKKRTIWIWILALILLLVGCKGKAAEEISLSRELDLAGICRINLTNAHNGETTAITEEGAIAEITVFLGEITGKLQGSGKGYYEGSYTLTFHYGDDRTAFLGFGDSDCFYLGTGNDGYPVRYALVDQSVSGDIIPFLSQFDQSGFSWESE